MATIRQFAAPQVSRRPSPFTTPLLVTMFWAAAAVLVVLTHRQLERMSPAVHGLAIVALIVLAAFGYMRVGGGREATVHQALGVGITWLTLCIVLEIVVTAKNGHPWFSVLGSPDHPVLRTAALFAWVFSPALFARRNE
jgi:uncharacterized membrane protein